MGQLRELSRAGREDKLQMLQITASRSTRPQRGSAPTLGGMYRRTVVGLLLTAGAGVNRVGAESRTALMIKARGFFPCVSNVCWIFMHRSTTSRWRRETAMIFAAENGSTLAYLLDRTAGMRVFYCGMPSLLPAHAQHSHAAVCSSLA